MKLPRRNSDVKRNVSESFERRVIRVDRKTHEAAKRIGERERRSIGDVTALAIEAYEARGAEVVTR